MSRIEKTEFKDGLLINGDSLEYLKSIPDNSIDFVLTDPPYMYKDINRKHREINSSMSHAAQTLAKTQNLLAEADITSGIDYDAYFNEWERVLKDMNLAVYCNSEQLVPYITLATEHGYKFKTLILKKRNPAPYKMAYANDIEFCLYIYDPKKPFKNYTNKKDSLVYEYLIGNSRKDEYGDMDNVNWHPTTKPLGHALMLVEKHTKPGDVVLDTFSGSGTTAMACTRLGRRFIAIELNNTFYTKSIDRIKRKEAIQSFDFGEDE